MTIGEPMSTPELADPLGPSSLVTQDQVSASGGTCGPLTVLAASVCGANHAGRGETREDAFAIGRTSDGTAIVAVADGLGSLSARYSAVGARVASVLSCELIRDSLEGNRPIDADTACAELAAGMMTAAQRFTGLAVEAKALATTLITAWISAPGKYQGFMIGDGGVFEVNAGQLSVVTRPRSAFAGETAALPAHYTRVREFSGSLADGSALLIATDGLANHLVSTDVAQVIGGNWQAPPSILGFLHDLSFDRRGAWDDRTAAAVWFRPGSGPDAGDAAR